MKGLGEAARSCSRDPEGDPLPPKCVHELDVVTLSREVAGWPRGTRGTVVHHRGDQFVVEVPSDEDLTFLDVHRGDVEVAVRHRPRVRHGQGPY